jgi:integrase
VTGELRLRQPPLPETPAARLRQAVRPEFDVDVFQPIRGDPVFWPACVVPGCDGVVDVVGLCRLHLLRVGTARRMTRLEVSRSSATEVQAFAQQQSRDAPPVPTRPPAYSFVGLPPMLADEIRLALQGIADAAGGGIHPSHFALATDQLLSLGISSVFDLSTTTPRQIVMSNPRELDLAWYSRSGDRSMQLVFLRKVMRAAAVHHAPIPVSERLVWYPQDFGLPLQTGGVHGIVFHSFKLPWMVDWAKRWVRHELTLGRQKFSSILIGVTGIRHLDHFLASQHDCPAGIADLSGDLLERFLLWLRADGGPGIDPRSSVSVVARVRALLRTHAEWQWEPTLRPDARLERGRAPKPKPPQPRPLDPFVLQQMMGTAFLASLEPSLADALIIGRHQGLRPSSLVALPVDCLQYNGEGETRPVLTYRNVKRSRGAEQPVTHQAVLDAIRRQQARVKVKYGEGGRWLFPALTNNPAGDKTSRPATLQDRLNHHLKNHFAVHDRDGARVTQMTWGQFRHTRATELLNDGLPPFQVATWLDHTGLHSLQHYCRVQSETLRQAVANAPLINLHGENLLHQARASAAAGRDVETLRQLVRQATNVVPGGLCTLPVREDCPHLNRCYSCDHFATTPGHLPELFNHLQASDLLAMAHEEQGRHRMAEGQRRAVADLRRVVTGLGRWVREHSDAMESDTPWLAANREVLDTLLDADDR